jgi:XTP/dITP diphosphohydrolase
MYQIVFATNNKHKLEEIRSILGDDFEVLSLSDIGCHEDIPETSDTLEGNAMQKAQYVFDKYVYDCFADDTGLEVDALGGEPGIYSARYAALDGDDSISHDSEANMTKLLRKLEGVENRKARFRTVIALITHPQSLPKGGKSDMISVNKGNQTSLPSGGIEGGYNPSPREGQRVGFEGIVNGSIISERRGGEGFGYDPIFQPEGYDKAFAELGSEIKNHISHRARAVEKLAHYLKEK